MHIYEEENCVACIGCHLLLERRAKIKKQQAEAKAKQKAEEKAAKAAANQAAKPPKEDAGQGRKAQANGPAPHPCSLPRATPAPTG